MFVILLGDRRLGARITGIHSIPLVTRLLIGFNLPTKMFQVWTGSHIGMKQRWDVLKECLESVAKLDLPHYLSISWDIEPLPEWFQHRKTLFPRATFWHAPQRLSQCQHFHALYQHVPRSTPPIIILDDDDILTRLPLEQTYPVTGMQYPCRPSKPTDWDMSQCYTRFQEFDSVSSGLDSGSSGLDSVSFIHYDMSGTILDWETWDAWWQEHLPGWFQKNPEFHKQLPVWDIYLRLYLDLPTGKNPWVFRRFWWLQDQGSWRDAWSQQPLNQQIRNDLQLLPI